MSRLLAGPLKSSFAPGATSCTISRSAVPSSPAPRWQRASFGTTTSGRSFVACAACRLSMPSEMTPTVTPFPSRPWARSSVGAARRVALRRDATRAGHGPIDASNRAHPREAGERLEGARVDARLHAAVRHLDAFDPHACLLQLLQLGGAERGAIEVHVQTPVGGERRRRGHEPARRGRRGRGRKKPGADLALLGVRCARRTDVVQLAEHPIERGCPAGWAAEATVAHNRAIEKTVS